RALGLDFIAVAGVQFCCGVTWDRAGDIAKGSTISDLTIDRLGSYKAGVVVHWCPSCDVHFSDLVTGRDAKTIPFDVTAAAAFLAGLSRRGKIPWRHPINRRAALHCHVGRENHPAGQRRAQADEENVSYLISQIQGLQFRGVVRAPAEYDYDCGLAHCESSANVGSRFATNRLRRRGVWMPIPWSPSRTHASANGAT